MLTFFVFIIVIFMFLSFLGSGVKDVNNTMNDTSSYLRKITAELEANKVLDTDTEEEKAIKEKKSKAIMNDFYMRIIIIVVVCSIIYFYLF